MKKQVTCSDCNGSKEIGAEALRLNLKKNGAYLCHKCATIRAGAAGKYSHTFEQRSQQSKQLWERPGFREIITNTSVNHNTTTEYKQIQSDRTKQLWEQPEYRQAVSTGVREALTDPEVCRRISKSLCDRYQSDPSYREKIASAASKRFEDSAQRAIASARTKLWWQEHRDELMVIFTSVAHREKLSKITKDLWQNKDFVASVVKERGHISKPQQLLYALLADNNINYHPESDKTIIGPWVFDCMIPYQNSSRSLLIEVQSYWHLSERQQVRDRSKFTYINRYHPEYDIMYIWDYEFYTKDRCVDRLLCQLGIKLDTIDFNFSEVRLSPPTQAELKTFLDLYHYIGKGRGGKSWGAYLNDQLIAVIVYSPPIRQNIAQQFNGSVVELSRFCIHPSYHRRNFASWMIGKTIKLLDSDNIIAYADTTVSHKGTIYRASNFHLHHRVPADYWYVDESGWVMHKKTLYSKARELHLTESEFADRFGYLKKFGGEKLCFHFDNH